MEEFIKKEPLSKKYFKKWIGSKEFINGFYRYCLWLGDSNISDIRKMPYVMEMLRLVKNFRLASKSRHIRDS